jgi:phage terminase small subunit
MPRKSSASLSTPSVRDINTSRLRPPDGLSESATQVFNEMVQSVGPRHFNRADAPLLTAYCRAVVAHREACDALEREGAVIGGRTSAWVAISERTGWSMAMFARSLRLTPQSRFDSRAAGRSSGAGEVTRQMDWSK